MKDLPFPMLADIKRDLCRALGILDPSAGVAQRATFVLDPEGIIRFVSVKAAAAIMGMNNIYYRFLHLSGNEDYSQIPARLRMQVIRSHGSDPVDFELWCVGVSAINGCGACVASHKKVLREKGVTEETILAAVRIASVIDTSAAVLDAPV